MDTSRIWCWTHYTTLNFDLNHDLMLIFFNDVFKVKVWNNCMLGTDDKPNNMKEKGYESYDPTHDIALGFSRLNLENNYIRITSDITSVHDKPFYQ